MSQPRRDNPDYRLPGPSALESEARSGSVLQRLFWFAALWLVGVVTVSIVAYGIRFLIIP